MNEIDLHKNPELTEWFEESLKAIFSREIESACIVAQDKDGYVLTGYYDADAQQKAVFAHNINSDAMLDVVVNNIGVIRDALDGLDDCEADDGK